MSIFHGAHRAMTDEQLCDQLLVDELMRFSLVDWAKQSDRRADTLKALLEPLATVTATAWPDGKRAANTTPCWWKPGKWMSGWRATTPGKCRQWVNCGPMRSCQPRSAPISDGAGCPTRRQRPASGHNAGERQ